MTNDAKTLDDHYTEVRIALERIDIAAGVLRRDIMENPDETEMKYLVDRISEHQEEARGAMDALYDCLLEAQPTPPDGAA